MLSKRMRGYFNVARMCFFCFTCGRCWSADEMTQVLGERWRIDGYLNVLYVFGLLMNSYLSVYIGTCV
jgi:hypothetical protein